LLLFVLLIDIICTLVNVVIANTTRANLVSWAVLSRGVVALLVAQVKERFHRDRYLTDVFFPLAIEVFGCFH
jgi:predicted naringenin-chalcone synthase